MRLKRIKHTIGLWLVVVALCIPLKVRSFSILAHEAIIDAEWYRGIEPLLLQKYPQATTQQLNHAHSYAYGGSLVSDMGYMPGGNAYFTDLLHYVHSGKFITNLIDEAQDINEYAFALGALSHYVADIYGHKLATNVTIPHIHPELKKQFGSVVTYDDDHTSHSRLEFAYDVIQIGRSNYASVAYHDLIGFNIAGAPLERAFLKTYGQPLNSVFDDLDSAVATMRWGVKDLFPALTRSAWESKKEYIVKQDNTANKHGFKYKMSRHMYKAEFPGKRTKPGFGARAIAFLVKLAPKIGPLKSLKFTYPGLDHEKRFEYAFDVIVEKFGQALSQLGDDRLALQDVNLDTGEHSVFGEYALADRAYCQLVMNLRTNGFNGLNAGLKKHLESYFANEQLHGLYKDNPETELQLRTALTELKAYRPARNGTGFNIALQ